MDTVENITDDVNKSIAYLAIAVAQAETGDIKGAMETAENITDYSKQWNIFWRIAGLQVETGDKAGARESLALAKKAAVLITDYDYKCRVYRYIADRQVKTSDTAGARDTAETITEVQSWIYFALDYQTNLLLADLQEFLESLKRYKSPTGVATDLTYHGNYPTGIWSMVNALKDLQDNEVKWSEKRSQLTQ